ncbi:MAG: hypothetical protein Q7R83_01900 [bacterium]|nr:hypothetical protein [bacterium]
MHQSLSLGRPDWEATDTDEDVETSNLSNLTLTMNDDDDDAATPIVKVDDDDAVIEEVPVVIEEAKAEEEELNELKALERLEKELKEDEMSLGDPDSDED